MCLDSDSILLILTVDITLSSSHLFNPLGLTSYVYLTFFKAYLCSGQDTLFCLPLVFVRLDAIRDVTDSSLPYFSIG